jgi:replicative DNA helicase
MTTALPSTVETESALIGALLIDPSQIDGAATRLRPQHFSDPLLARMFAAIRYLHDDSKPVTGPAVIRHLGDDPDLAAVGGPGFVARLTGDPYASFALAEIEHLIETGRRRLLIAGLEAGVQELADISIDVDAAVQTLETKILSSVSHDLRQRTYTMASAFADALDRMERLARGEIDPGVLIHGFQDWNDITGGLQPGDYLVLGGRPSMGKTALSLGVAWRAAAAGHGVLYISREMDITQLMPRILADLLHDAGGKGTFDDVRKGKVGAQDMAILREIERQVAGFPLTIVDPDQFSAMQIGSLVRRHRDVFRRRGCELGLVIIDYLGLIDPPAGKPNREQEITAISKAIKGAARSNQVPIIVLSQLSRAVEQREDKRPQLSDLRDSGSLEQDADQVLFVYRDEYYLKRCEPDPADAKKRESWEQEMRAARDRIDIYSAKNRQGELHRRKAWFFGQHQAIRNSDFYKDGGFR